MQVIMTVIYRIADPKDSLNKAKFTYQTTGGIVVKDRHVLEWIDGLRIPPAWSNVVIYPSSKKQTCCGVDPAGRQQCLYHKIHVSKARKEKYCGLIEFCLHYPQILRDIDAKLASSKLSKNRVTALVLKIIIHCNFRLGTLKYEEQNESFGVTTVLKKHLKFRDDAAEFSFIGKKGVVNECIVRDAATVAALRDFHVAPHSDQHLMMYQFDGRWYVIKHTEINDYLKAWNPMFTSKDFRTYQSNIVMIDELEAHDPAKLTPAQRKKRIIETVRAVAAQVHNTPAICKKDYIDTELIMLYIEHPIRYRSLMITPTSSSRIRFMNWLKLKC